MRLMHLHYLIHERREELTETEINASRADEAVEIYTQCAVDWMRLYSDRKRASICLKKAEISPNKTTARDYIYLAWAYKKALNSEDEFDKNLAKAYQLSRDDEQRVDCVKLLMMFKYYDKALKMIKILKTTSTRRNIELLEILIKTKKYPERYRYSRMIKAEDCATNCIDYDLCAKYWKKLFNDVNRAKACKDKANELRKKERSLLKNKT
jgi:hypothetical protein